jgi:hypothetical protein
MMERPPGFQRRDLLVGVLVASAIKLDLHPALDIASKACAPLFEDYPPDPKRWYPNITPAHARAAIAYAGRARGHGAITAEEYEWVTQMARKAILHDSSTVADAPSTRPRPRLLLRDYGDDDDPQAA